MKVFRMFGGVEALLLEGFAGGKLPEPSAVWTVFRIPPKKSGEVRGIQHTT